MLIAVIVIALAAAIYLARKSFLSDRSLNAPSTGPDAPEVTKPTRKPIDKR